MKTDADILMEDLLTRSRGPRSYGEISDYCGISKLRLIEIEQRALGKIRSALQRVAAEHDIINDTHGPRIQH